MSDNDLWKKLKQEDEVLSLENEKLEPLLDEINMIKDDAIRSFTRALMLAVDDFWIGPSSPSGKYHPPDEHGFRGDVLHTRRVVAITSLLADSQDRNDFETDMLLSAALLHDITKIVQWDNSGKMSSDKLHPITVDRLFSEVRAAEQENKKPGSTTLDLDSDTISRIMRLVRCHLGRWSPIPELIPVTPFEMTVHWADYIAANLHKVVDFEML